MFLFLCYSNIFFTFFFFFFFFFNDTATTEIYTLSLHDALPISRPAPPPPEGAVSGLASGLSVEPAAGHGQPRDVRHHGPDPTVGRPRDPAVLQPGLPARGGPARAVEPEDPDGVAGHPRLLDGGPDRTDHRGQAGPQGQGGRGRGGRCRGSAARSEERRVGKEC